MLGTAERARRDAYFKLQAYGIDPLTVGMTLFAAMFSVGTITIKSIELMQEHEVDYDSLDLRQKLTFVLECLRLYPTVTTVHRIVERDEEVLVAGGRIAEAREAQPLFRNR
jgi:ABC-type arginine transport system ATPase subunit